MEAVLMLEKKIEDLAEAPQGDERVGPSPDQIEPAPLAPSGGQPFDVPGRLLQDPGLERR